MSEEYIVKRNGCIVGEFSEEGDLVEFFRDELLDINTNDYVEVRNYDELKEFCEVSEITDTFEFPLYLSLETLTKDIDKLYECIIFGGREMTVSDIVDISRESSPFTIHIKGE